MPWVAVRAWALGDVLDEVVDRGRVEADIAPSIARAGGRSEILACGPVGVDANSLLRPAFAWELDVPLDRVGSLDLASAGVAFALVGGADEEAASVLAATPLSTPLVSASDRWMAYAVACDGG
jgi:hypothetical protein